MQMVRLEDYPEIQAAKNTMFGSLLTFFVCYLLGVVPIIQLIASVVMLGAIVWYFVGVYKFSKLTNSSIFQSHTFIVWIIFGFVSIVAIMISVAMQGGEEQLKIFISIVGLVYFIDIWLIMWYFWRICAEFHALTNLRQFILAFKFYAVSFVLAIISIIWIVIASVDDPFALPSIFAEVLIDILEKYPYYRLDIQDIPLIYIPLLVFVIAFISAILSIIFYLLGIAKITNVGIKEQSKK